MLPHTHCRLRVVWLAASTAAADSEAVTWLASYDDGTGVDAGTWVRYLYATSWGPEEALFSTGTRREPQADPAACLGDSFSAPGVPYEAHHEEWAFERTARLYGVSADDVQRVENYTACFPTAMDGHIFAEQLTACNDTYPRLFVLNGLAGGGIARGPGAGLHMARLVAASLGVAAGPADLPESDVVWTLVDMGALAGTRSRPLLWWLRPGLCPPPCAPGSQPALAQPA